MTKSKDYENDKVKYFEILFVEGLPIPVMNIYCFSPFENGTSSVSDNKFHSNESSPIVVIKIDCKLCHLDLYELEND